MRVWHSIRADLTRPERAAPHGELGVQIVAPFVIVALAQGADPGTVWELALLVPAVAAFILRAVVPRFPAELFALLVVVPVAAAVGHDGALEGSFFLIVLMVLYTAWTLGSVGRALFIAGLALVTPWLVSHVLAPDSGIAWTPWAIACGFTFALGRTLQRQRTLIEQLEEARQALAMQAVSEERRRIARELHDLAGHTLAAVVLHVTGARHVLRRDVDEAERALRDAEAVGRSSLDQIRATVAALRADERGTDPALAGTRELTELVDAYRRAGLVIESDITASASEIDGPVGTAVHRITREALANVAHHAPGNRVELRVGVHDELVHVAVIDRGQRGLAPDPQSLHFGLIGMTERARALGGHLDAGPTDDGWRVEAVLPLAGVHSERVSR